MCVLIEYLMAWVLAGNLKLRARNCFKGRVRIGKEGSSDAEIKHTVRTFKLNSYDETKHDFKC